MYRLFGCVPEGCDCQQFVDDKDQPCICKRCNHSLRIHYEYESKQDVAWWGGTHMVLGYDCGQCDRIDIHSHTGGLTTACDDSLLSDQEKSQQYFKQRIEMNKLPLPAYQLVLAMLSGLVLMGCIKAVAVKPPTFEDQLFASEKVHCADIMQHDPSVAAPDCRKLFDAFDRGRARVVKLYPDMANYRMAGFNFSRTSLIWNPGEAFPRMGNGPTPGAIADNVGCLFIYYSFEQAVEHEITHALTCAADALHLRTPEALNSPKDADQIQYKNLYQITCHNTSDDPYGDGTSISVSGRAGCIQPYNGSDLH